MKRHLMLGRARQGTGIWAVAAAVGLAGVSCAVDARPEPVVPLVVDPPSPPDDGPGTVVPPADADDACPRNMAILKDLSRADLPCQDDGSCPAGAGCNVATGTCTVRCLPGAEDDGLKCPAGSRCDCYGRCSEGAPEAMPPFAGRLRFARTAVVLRANAGEPGAAQALIEPRLDETLPSGAADAEVMFTAPAGLEVACWPGAPWRRQCRARLRAGKASDQVAVRGVLAHGGVGTVRFSSRELYPRTGAVSIVAEVRSPPEGAAVHLYTGQASLVQPLATSAVELDLHARREGAVVVLEDVAGDLLPPGGIRLTLEPQGEGGLAATSVLGIPEPAPIRTITLSLASVGAGALAGELTLAATAGAATSWRLALTEDAAGSSSGLTGAAALAPAPGSVRTRSAVAEADGAPSSPEILHGGRAAAYRAWADIIRSGTCLRSAYHNLGDGRPNAGPGLSPALLGPLDQVFGAGDGGSQAWATGAFKPTLKAMDLVLWDGSRRDAFAEVVAENLRSGPTAPGPMVLCLANTTADHGLLQPMDCGRVVGDARAGEATLAACRRLPGAKIFYCPGDRSCDNQPSYEDIRLCPLGYTLAQQRADTVASLLCFDPGAADAQSGMRSAEMSRLPSDASGDLLCAGSGPQRAFPLFENHVDGGQGTGQALLGACLQELEAMPPAGAPSGMLPDAADAVLARAAWSTSHAVATCFSPAHFYAAVDEARRAPVGDPAAQRLFHRLLQQWTSLHVFIAEEGAREHALRGLLAADSSALRAASSADLAPVADIGAALLEGWRFLFSTGLADAAGDLDPAVLAAPDYRPTSSLGPYVTGEPSIGLPATWLEGAASMLRFAAFALTSEGGETDPPNLIGQGPAHQGSRAQAVEMVKVAHAVRARADAAYGRAGRATREAIGWRRRFITATEEFNAALRSVDSLLAATAAGSPAESLADDLVPLYSDGALGASRQFFASSDYLVTHYAEPAIARAEHLLEGGVRQQWVSMLQSSLQDAVGFDAIEARYGAPLAALCGLDAAESRRVVSGLARGDFVAAQCFVRPECRDSAAAEPRRDDRSSTRSPAAVDLRCLRGAVGEAAALVTAARQDVAIARSHADDYLARYETQAANCAALQAHLEGDESMIEAHAAEMGRLRVNKAIADQLENGFAAGSAVFTLDNAVTFGGHSALRILAGAARAASIELQRQRESEEENFQAAMAHRSHLRQVVDCYHEADVSRLGMATQWKQIERRATDVVLALMRLESQQSQALSLAAEGTAVIAREQERGSATQAHRQWLRRDVEQFGAAFDWARRTTHLALRALEYDLQESLPERHTVLTARHPATLRQVLATIDARRLPRRLVGQLPEERHLTVSLRDDLLRLADQSQTPDGLRHGTREERFAHFIQSDAAAVYDTAGAYLGQGVRFTLPPAKTEDECAERVWRVGAAIRGKFPPEAPISTRVLLYKAGVFASKWCAPRAEGPDMQTGALPLTNMARSEVGGGRGGTEAVTSSRAVLDVRRDIEPGVFANHDFREGTSDAFAGQGLYGAYALVFKPDAAFALADIEDVVLRFDYLSVTPPPPAPPAELNFAP